MPLKCSAQHEGTGVETAEQRLPFLRFRSASGSKRTLALTPTVPLGRLRGTVLSTEIGARTTEIG